jgi:hypothetical protein
VFSVTVFTALLGNGFQQRTILCSRGTSSQAGGHLTPTSYSSNCRLRSQDFLVMADGPRRISARTTQKTPLPLLRVLSLQGNVPPELFLSNGCCTVSCLHGCYLAMGLHATILMNIQELQQMIRFHYRETLMNSCFPFSPKKCILDIRVFCTQLSSSKERVTEKTSPDSYFSLTVVTLEQNK